MIIWNDQPAMKRMNYGADLDFCTWALIKMYVPLQRAMMSNCVPHAQIHLHAHTCIYHMLGRVYADRSRHKVNSQRLVAPHRRRYDNRFTSVSRA